MGFVVLEYLSDDDIGTISVSAHYEVKTMLMSKNQRIFVGEIK